MSHLEDVRAYAQYRHIPVDVHYGKTAPTVHMTPMQVAKMFVIWVSPTDEHILITDANIVFNKVHELPGAFQARAYWKKLEDWKP